MICPFLYQVEMFTLDDIVVGPVVPHLRTAFAGV